jgi:hypothetical protein
VSILGSVNGSRSTTDGTLVIAGSEEATAAQEMVPFTSDEESHTAMPEYWFARRHRDMYLQFQSDIRGVKLLREYHVSTITSKHSKAGADADEVKVKLWCNADNPEQAVMSSLAEFQDDRRIFEWPLRWFQSPELRKDRAVRLTLLAVPSQPPSPEVQSGGNGVFSRVGRAVMPRRTSTQSNTGPTAIVSRATSVQSVDTDQLGSSYADASWINKVCYLDMRFETTEDATAFTADVEKLQAAIYRLGSPGPSTVPSSSYASTLPSSTHTSLFASPEIQSFVGSPLTPDISPNQSFNNTSQGPPPELGASACMDLDASLVASSSPNHRQGSSSRQASYDQYPDAAHDFLMLSPIMTESTTGAEEFAAIPMPGVPTPHTVATPQTLLRGSHGRWTSASNCNTTPATPYKFLRLSS